MVLSHPIKFSKRKLRNFTLKGLRPPFSPTIPPLQIWVFLAFRLSAFERVGEGMHWMFAGYSFVAFCRAMLSANTITEMVATKFGRVTLFIFTLFGTIKQSINQEMLFKNETGRHANRKPFSFI